MRRRAAERAACVPRGTVAFDVPAGVLEGMDLRVAGQGNAGTGRRPSGRSHRRRGGRALGGVRTTGPGPLRRPGRHDHAGHPRRGGRDRDPRRTGAPRDRCRDRVGHGPAAEGQGRAASPAARTRRPLRHPAHRHASRSVEGGTVAACSGSPSCGTSRRAGTAPRRAACDGPSIGHEHRTPPASSARSRRARSPPTSCGSRTG